MPAMLTGMFGLGLYALLWPDVMDWRDVWPWLAVFVQCLWLAASLGRFQTPAFAYFYSRGYSRDALWTCKMLVSVLSILVGWLPAALIVWTGLRSVIRDRLFLSPYFPIMAAYETWVPVSWLAVCLLLTAAFHYVWIRQAQPTKGQQSGLFVAVGLIFALVTIFNSVNFYHGWIAWLLGVSYAIVLICLVLGGRVLHRSLEVRT
jgi:hypothetical protein